MVGLVVKKIRTDDGDWFVIVIAQDRECSGETAPDTSLPFRQEEVIGILRRGGVRESEIQFMMSQAESEWQRLQKVQ